MLLIFFFQIIPNNLIHCRKRINGKYWSWTEKRWWIALRYRAKSISNTKSLREKCSHRARRGVSAAAAGWPARIAMRLFELKTSKIELKFEPTSLLLCSSSLFGSVLDTFLFHSSEHIYCSCLFLSWKKQKQFLAETMPPMVRRPPKSYRVQRRIKEMQYTEMASISVTAMMLTNNIAGRRILFILTLLLLAEIDQITTLKNHIGQPIEVTNSFILPSFVTVNWFTFSMFFSSLSSYVSYHLLLKIPVVFMLIHIFAWQICQNWPIVYVSGMV